MSSTEISYLHSGGMGDIIYAMKTVEKLGPGILYTQPAYVDLIGPLLKTQRNIIDVKVGVNNTYVQWREDHPNLIPDDQITYNLDKFRCQPNIGFHSLIVAHLRAFDLGIKHWADPWMYLREEDKVDLGLPPGYVVINRTERYNNPHMDWNLEVSFIKTITPHIYFIGSENEYEIFMSQNALHGVKYLPTKNLLEAASVISNSLFMSGNCSSCMAVAKALGHKHRVEQPLKHNNCITNTPEETLLTFPYY